MCSHEYILLLHACEVDEGESNTQKRAVREKKNDGAGQKPDPIPVSPAIEQEMVIRSYKKKIDKMQQLGSQVFAFVMLLEC